MNVYDFDKTIYRGDSTVDFWRPLPKAVSRGCPGAAGTLAKALAFRQGNCSREQFKERFYQFLRFVPEAAQEAERFWDRHLIGIELWYRAQQSNTDVIISASPDFLIGAGLPPPGRALSRFAGGRAYRTAVGTELPGRRKSAALPERLRRGGGGTVLFRLLF